MTLFLILTLRNRNLKQTIRLSYRVLSSLMLYSALFSNKLLGGWKFELKLEFCFPLIADNLSRKNSGPIFNSVETWMRESMNFMSSTTSKSASTKLSGGSRVIRSVEGGDRTEEDDVVGSSNGLSAGEESATSTRSDGKGPSHHDAPLVI